jgi:toxin FitB
MIILDTNVLSALMRERPDQEVVRWLNEQPRTSVWTTSITVFEIRFGIRILAAGKKQQVLNEAFNKLIDGLIERRIADFDGSAAQEAADLMAARQKKGLSGELRDTMIAGIAMARHATLATRNTRHFEGASFAVVNPWGS